MCNKIVFLLFLLASLSRTVVVNGQLYNSGQLFVDSGTVLYIKDTLQNSAAATVIIKGIVSANGAFINNASITGKGKVVFSGTSPQNISGTGTLSNVEVNTAGATIMTGSMQNILDTLTLTAGILTANEGLTLRSTAINTARVAPVIAGSIAGNVFVERYIPGRRAWRLITTPLSNANTIYEAWENSGTNVPGIGTFITGPGGGNGLDNGNNYSLKSYDTTSQQLVNVTNTNVSLSTTLPNAANKGHFLFVRGDRNPANLTPPNTNTTTLKSEGSLQTGTQTFVATSKAGEFTLVGNPYASPVDFDLVTRNNLAKRFYAWDPALNVVGGYVLVDDADSNGTYSIVPSSTQTNILQSSQAIFVQTATTAPASLVFNEPNKSAVTTNAGFRTNNGLTEILRTNLYLKNADNTTTLADGVLSKYDNSYSRAVDMQDGVKIANINESLSIERTGHSLSIERSPLIDVSDTLFLKLSNSTTRKYQWEFLPFNFSSVRSAWLEDKFLNTITPLSITDPTRLDFMITADAASAAANRFRVVFKTSSLLPVDVTDIRAYQKDAGIQVDWNIAPETNIRRYELEKSADGAQFTKVTETAARLNNNSTVSYNWFDVNPFSGNNFYRIKVIGSLNTSDVKYSQIVNVKIGNGKSSITIYPNPVSNQTINIQLNNQPFGTYTVQLYNASGQLMLTKAIDHLGGSLTQAIQLDKLITKGVYQVHVSNGKNKINKQIVIE